MRYLVSKMAQNDSYYSNLSKTKNLGQLFMQMRDDAPKKVDCVRMVTATICQEACLRAQLMAKKAVSSIADTKLTPS